jgi:hypothetical protein
MVTSMASAGAWAPMDVLTLAFSAVRFSITESVPEELTITSKGRGNTQEEAVYAALVDSVQRGIGILVITDQSVQNDKVVRNLAANYSSGVVNSYKIDSCEKDKVMTCTVTAKVSPWKFMRKLAGDSKTIQVSGSDLYAQHETSKAVLIQREKMTRYYFSQIRQSGLDAKIKEVKIQPGIGDKATVVVDYQVKWNPEFKKEMIRYLQKLEKDTAGEENGQVYIQWGPTGLFENRVRINTHNPVMQSVMEEYIYMRTYVGIKELGICQDIRQDDVFKVDWYGVQRKITVEVPAEKLKGIQSLSITTGCAS